MSPSKLPFCSILITHYNGKDLLKDCLGALKKINYPKDKFEVIMIDNDSTDDSDTQPDSDTQASAS